LQQRWNHCLRQRFCLQPLLQPSSQPQLGAASQPQVGAAAAQVGSAAAQVGSAAQQLGASQQLDSHFGLQQRENN
jgi:hypothetical protein